MTARPMQSPGDQSESLRPDEHHDQDATRRTKCLTVEAWGEAVKKFLPAREKISPRSVRRHYAY